MGMIIQNGKRYYPVGKPTFKLFSGKITSTTGVMLEDADFVYTDFIPIPNGEVTFDLGLSSTRDYTGLTLYKENKTYVDYWLTTSRYRAVNLSTYYSNGARYFRLSLPKTQLHYIFVHDWVNNKIYCYDEAYQTIE